MKKIIFISILFCSACYKYADAQVNIRQYDYQAPPTTLEERRERRQNLVVKEWNTEGRRRWLDRFKVYNPDGFIIEDIEYASYGQRVRVVSRYEDGKCIEEIEYNERNRVVRIRKFEYNLDGTKKMQYNYLPNGKLYSTKVFEYSYQ